MGGGGPPGMGAPPGMGGPTGNAGIGGGPPGMAFGAGAGSGSAYAPPEVSIDLAAQQRAEAEMMAASQVALPDDEDDDLDECCEESPGEMMVHIWNAITQSANIKNIQKMHKMPRRCP